MNTREALDIVRQANPVSDVTLSESEGRKASELLARLMEQTPAPRVAESGRPSRSKRVPLARRPLVACALIILVGVLLLPATGMSHRLSNLFNVNDWFHSHGGSSTVTVEPNVNVDLTTQRPVIQLKLDQAFSTWPAGSTIALWKVGATNGATCLFVAQAHPAPAANSYDPTKTPAGGRLVCSSPTGEWPVQKGRFLDVQTSGGATSADSSEVLVRGEIAKPVSGARIVLRTPEGTTPVTVTKDGYFLGQFVYHPSASLPPHGAFQLILSDRNGKQLEAVDLHLPSAHH